MDIEGRFSPRGRERGTSVGALLSGRLPHRRPTPETPMRFHHRPGKSILLLLVGCALFALAAGIGVGMFMGKRAQAGATDKQSDKKSKKKVVSVQTVYSIGEQVVNLADTAELRYAKMTVALGLEEKVPEEKLKPHLPVLRDVVIGVVTRKRFAELHGKGGIKRLKQQLLDAMQDRIPEVTVTQIYFEQFAMQ
jgi:flagellar basal body-associated protein FliL